MRISRHRIDMEGGSIENAKGGVPVGTMMEYGGRTAPTGWLLCYGQAVSRTTYADLFAVLATEATITVTIATPGVVSWTSHGLSAGDPVSFTTTGALPTGITAGTTYYVISAGITADSFRIATTASGSAINTTGSQSGTHTALYAPYGRGDGSTTFNLPDLRGRVAVGHDDMGGTSANRLTNPAATLNGLDGDVLGGTGGAETHTLTTAQMPSHTHNVASSTGSGSGGFWPQDGSVQNVATSSAGSNQAHNNVQPSLVVNKIIYTGV